MIFGDGVDTEAGTYTVFEEVGLSVRCPCGRTLRVVVAKRQEVAGRAALSSLVNAHREACELRGTEKEPLALPVKVDTVVRERKVKWMEPGSDSMMPPSDDLEAAALCAQPEAPLEELKK